MPAARRGRGRHSHRHASSSLTNSAAPGASRPGAAPWPGPATGPVRVRALARVGSPAPAPDRQRGAQPAARCHRSAGRGPAGSHTRSQTSGGCPARGRSRHPRKARHPRNHPHDSVSPRTRRSQSTGPIELDPAQPDIIIITGTASQHPFPQVRGQVRALSVGYRRSPRPTAWTEQRPVSPRVSGSTRGYLRPRRTTCTWVSPNFPGSSVRDVRVQRGFVGARCPAGWSGVVGSSGLSGLPGRRRGVGGLDGKWTFRIGAGHGGVRASPAGCARGTRERGRGVGAGCEATGPTGTGGPRDRPLIV
jgi:hypothetical protein